MKAKTVHQIDSRSAWDRQNLYASNPFYDPKLSKAKSFCLYINERGRVLSCVEIPGVLFRLPMRITRLSVLNMVSFLS